MLLKQPINNLLQFSIFLIEIKRQFWHIFLVQAIENPNLMKEKLFKDFIKTGRILDTVEKYKGF